MNEYLTAVLIIAALVWTGTKAVAKKFRAPEWIALVLGPIAAIAAHASGLLDGATTPVWKGYLTAGVFGLLASMVALGATGLNALSVLPWAKKTE